MRRQVCNPYTTWVRCFAWLPVEIGNTEVWLEPVERRLLSELDGWGYSYEYRLPMSLSNEPEKKP